MNTADQFTARDAIIQTVSQIFINTDERNWDQVKAQFADEVLLDYISMAGGEPSKLPSQAIVDSWKGLLPGFNATQHAVSNFVVRVDGDEATVFHYGTAWHYLPNEEGGVIWVVVGTYDHHLVRKDGQWRVDRMKFNFKFSDGNNDLPRLARERLLKPSANQK